MGFGKPESTPRFSGLLQTNRTAACCSGKQFCFLSKKGCQTFSKFQACYRWGWDLYLPPSFSTCWSKQLCRSLLLRCSSARSSPKYRQSSWSFVSWIHFTWQEVIKDTVRVAHSLTRKQCSTLSRQAADLKLSSILDCTLHWPTFCTRSPLGVPFKYF